MSKADVSICIIARPDPEIQMGDSDGKQIENYPPVSQPKRKVETNVLMQDLTPYFIRLEEL